MHLESLTSRLVSRMRSGIALGTLVLAVLVALPGVARAQTGTITGTVTNSATSAPVSGVPVALVNFVVSAIVGQTTTNGSGVYTFSAVPAGRYYVITSTAAGLVNEVYNNRPCPTVNCAVVQLIQAGDPVTVTSGGTTSGINFALDPGGSVSGTVTDSTTLAPLAGIPVQLLARLGTSIFSVGSATTNASGAYTISGLPAGTYFALTSNTSAAANYVNEIFDNIPCPGQCSATTAVNTGAPIVVTAGSAVTGRNFALDAGGRVTGNVTNAATAAPIQNVPVFVYTRVAGSATFAGSGTTDATGAYSVGGLPTGTYYALTNNNVGFTNEIYDNILCPIGCSSTTAVASGAEIPVTAGATTSGKNFALDAGGQVSGTVTDEGTGLPIPGMSVNVATRVGTTVFSGFSAVTDAAGQYTVRGLPTGTYFPFISSSPGYAPEIFDNQPCAIFCSSATATTSGTAVPVTLGATTGGRNFALVRAATISGTVTDAVTAQPLQNTPVTAFLQQGTTFVSTSVSTNASGVFTFSALTPGTYYLQVSARGYVTEMYDNVPCPGGNCSITSGTAITLAAGSTATGRDTALSPAGILGGLLTDAATGAPLAGTAVNLYSRTGTTNVFAGVVTTSFIGRYEFTSLPTGTYFAFTSGANTYLNEIFDNIPCPTTGCVVNTATTTGTGIPVVAGSFATANIALATRTDAPGAPFNFVATAAGFGGTFTWNAPTSGGPVSDYVIEAGGSPGTTFISIPATGTSFTAPSIPPGRYFVRVRGRNAAGTGLPSNEVELVVSGGGVAPGTPTNLTAFMAGGRLTATWGAPASGGSVSGYLLEAGSSTGAADIATVPVPIRSFTFDPTPNGFYFLRVRAVGAGGVSAPSAEVMIVVGGVPAPPGAPVNLTRTVSGSTVTFNWTAPATGSPTSYRLEAGSASGLSDIAVANTGSTATTISFSSVPPGTYFVRLRAVNALGASVVSNEVIVVVS